MPSVSPLAQKALDAIQAAVPSGEAHFERGQAVINLMKLVPSGSALARALLMEKVWSSTLRDQHVRAWSGNQQYSYLQHVGSGGFQMHYFLELVDKAVASESVAQIEERHITRALVGDDWNALRDVGISGKGLYDEVVTLEAASVPAMKTKAVAVRLDNLHPLIDKAAAGLYGNEHYGDAIFAAFRAVENRVRTLSGLDLTGQRFDGKGVWRRFSANSDCHRERSKRKG